jgi:hypothetical protein
VYDHCPLQSAYWLKILHVQQFCSHLPRPRSPQVPSWCCPASLGHMCYLEVAGGFTYTLHVSPPRDGACVLSPWALKDHPCPSFISRWHLLLRLKRAWHLLHAGELLGSPRYLLSVASSTWFVIKIHVHVNTVSSLLLRLIPWLSSSVMLYWFVHVRACNVLSLSHVWSPNGGKSSRVSHMSGRMVWTCCWRSPSTGLRPPPQLTSHWLLAGIKDFNSIQFCRGTKVTHLKSYFIDLMSRSPVLMI